MSGNRTCNACNKEFSADSNIDDKKLHYKSDWHRYNLKRKIAGLEWISEDLYRAKQLEKDNKLDETPMLYTCSLCCKSYKSPKAHAQHLTSKTHLMRASLGQNPHVENDIIIIRPLMRRISATPSSDESESDDVEFEEDSRNTDVEDGLFEEDFDPTCCFMCDFKNRTLEACMVHMHKKHGFFIPDIEYLKDAKGLLTCLGLKVRRDFLCLYCNERRHSFSSLEAVRKHMEAKGHCKVHETFELEDFYEYSNRYMDKDAEQLVPVNNDENGIKFGRGGRELILKKTADGRVSTKTLGCRKFLRYYRQRSRPCLRSCSVIVALTSSRFNFMGLSTMQSKKMKDMRLFNMHQSKIARSLGLPIMQSTKKVRVMTMRMWKQIRRIGAIKIRDSCKNSNSIGSFLGRKGF